MEDADLFKQKLDKETVEFYREIIQQKLEEARTIGKDVEQLIRQLQDGCLHEAIAERQKPFGDTITVRKCLSCGLEEAQEKDFDILKDPPKVVLARDDFDQLGIIPTLRVV